MISYDGLSVCRVSGLENLGEANRWPRSHAAPTRLSWQVVSDLPGIARDAFRTAVAEACLRWSGVCGLEFFEGSGSDANLLVTTQREGPGGVLADCELPYPGIDSRASLKLRVDEADAWAIADNPPPNRVGLVHVLTHEIGHGVGLGHGPQGCLMAPTYSPRVNRPQSWDVVEARARYGDRAVVSVAPPQGPPIGVPPEGAGRRRFDGRVLRGLVAQFPALGGLLGAAGIDPTRIPDLVDLPDGLGDMLGAGGLELLSVRLSLGGGLDVRVLGKAFPLGGIK